jgi:hypothetical protein
MSVRTVLQWPAEASHVLARSDRYKVTHTNLNIPKYVERKALCRLVRLVAIPLWSPSSNQESVIKNQIHAELFSPRLPEL